MKTYKKNRVLYLIEILLYATVLPFLVCCSNSVTVCMGGFGSKDAGNSKELKYNAVRQPSIHTGSININPGNQPTINSLVGLDKDFKSTFAIDATNVVFPLGSTGERMFLGAGVSGKVYKGVYKHIDVAVKEFIQEYETMISLRAPNILDIYGYTLSPNYSIVMEYMPKGSLHSVLKKELLPWNIRLQIATDVAIGVAFLHSKKIIHRDIKSLNILIKPDYTAKICDFGLSKMLEKSQSKVLNSNPNDSGLGTISYMAPELFDLVPVYSEKSDIYAMGITFWDIALHGQTLFKGVQKNRATIIPVLVKEGKRDNIPADCHKEIASIIKDCWAQNPKKRPTADEVVLRLRQIKITLPPNPQKNVSNSKLEEEFKENSTIQQPIVEKELKELGKKKFKEEVIVEDCLERKEWEVVFGEVGDVPSLPSDIEQILNSDCPYFEGKKIKETHLLTLIPKTVNKKPLTLRSLGNLRGTTKYDVLNVEKHADTPVKKPYWVLVTKDVIPSSRNKNFKEQQSLVAINYSIPKAIEVAVTILLHQAKTGESLYSDNPLTYTLCEEKVGAYQICVGSMGKAGLRIFYFDNSTQESVGIASLRKF